jgi:DNA-nicking Smr family endonuclease
VQDSIDLHGMNRVSAAEAVAEFLRSSAARGIRCVRIVHGKGRGSLNREPVLKAMLRKWLPAGTKCSGSARHPRRTAGVVRCWCCLRSKR